MTLAPQILVYSDDLMWVGRITAVAEQLGLSARGMRTVAQLIASLSDTPARCLVLDLGMGDASQVVAELTPVLTPETRLVAFGSHVDANALAQARQAGCDPVLPRSTFAERLPELLTAWTATT
ncbi:MAG TPA: hypothetical protein PKD86_01520 [Gemmatales bacterium]|nr:hypothetical protein [Gemmatales bacterium]HMP58005.1 hypothetical protein [Gemmatales bacterium]